MAYSQLKKILSFEVFIKTDLAKFIEPDEPTKDGRRGKLLFLHLCSVDDAGHHGGYDGPLYDRVVKHADDVIEQIYRIYRESVSHDDLASTTFIITADHGTKAKGKRLFELKSERQVQFTISDFRLNEGPLIVR